MCILKRFIYIYLKLLLGAICDQRNEGSRPTTESNIKKHNWIRFHILHWACAAGTHSGVLLVCYTVWRLWSCKKGGVLSANSET